MDTKVCSKCGVKKYSHQFRSRKDSKDGLRNECKDCSLILQRIYKEKNESNIQIKKKKYYQENKSKILDKVKKHRLNNINIIREKDRDRSKIKYKENPEKLKIYYENNKEKILEYKKNWSVVNRDKIKIQKKEYIKNRKKLDILYYLKSVCRLRLYHFLNKNNITKNNKTFEIIGCTPQELKEHLEKQFVVGMSWENKNLWHIDHIIPLSSAKTEEELYKLCHFTNLQPLWAEENLKKSNKILVEQFKK